MGIGPLRSFFVWFSHAAVHMTQLYQSPVLSISPGSQWTGLETVGKPPFSALFVDRDGTRPNHLNKAGDPLHACMHARHTPGETPRLSPSRIKREKIEQTPYVLLYQSIDFVSSTLGRLCRVWANSCGLNRKPENRPYKRILPPHLFLGKPDHPVWYDKQLNVLNWDRLICVFRFNSPGFRLINSDTTCMCMYMHNSWHIYDWVLVISGRDHYIWIDAARRAGWKKRTIKLPMSYSVNYNPTRTYVSSAIASTTEIREADQGGLGAGPRQKHHANDFRLSFESMLTFTFRLGACMHVSWGLGQVVGPGKQIPAGAEHQPNFS